MLILLEGSLTTVRFCVLMMLGATLAFGQVKPLDNAERCRNILDLAIHDKNPDVRKGAAEALSLLGVRQKALESLTPMLNDRDVTVRIAVVTSLGDLKDRRTLPFLKKALDDPVAEVDFAAAKVLYQLRDPAGEEFLFDVVFGESKASSSFLNKQKRSALRMLHTPTKLFIYIGAQAAGMAPVPGLGFGISSAEGILLDPDTSARAASLLLIGNSRDPGLSAAVESALGEKDWSLRAAAVHVVAMHPFPALRERLIPLLSDRRGAVRVRAAAAYLRLDPDARPAPLRRTARTR